jgi:two-component system OmpR family response regulator
MMNQRTAVVVEDDSDVGALIQGLLDQAGFTSTVVQTGAEALGVIREQLPDLVTLDMSLPDIDGVEVCRQVRLISDCYIIVISARTSEIDRLVGLEVGADDYLVKPFSMRELQARVAALFRRPRMSEPPPEARRAPAALATPTTNGRVTAETGQLGCEHLSLDAGAREVRVGGEEIELTRTEFDLLAHLVGHPGVVVPREDLLRAVWATDFVPESTHVVDVHLANLRRKLRTDAAKARDHEWIRTIRGVGFRFDPCCS